MRGLLKLAGALGLAFAGVGATAQDIAEMRALDGADTAYRNGEYLKAAMTLRPLALKPDGTIADQMAYQVWTQISAAVDDAPPIADAPSRPAPLGSRDEAALDGVTFADALPEIAARAAGTRVVILNENHSISRDRAFGLAVARALRPLGYDILAAETLANSDDPASVANRMEAMRLGAAPAGRDGYYLRDPEFADFIRQAIRIGYRPAPYEATRESKSKDRYASIATRESQEAANLARLIAAHPSSRFLIYVGFSHVAEAPLDNGTHPIRWMAARLKALTGIDPLTIDQTTITERLGWTAAYQRLAPRLPDRDVVLMHANRPAVLGQFDGAVDLQVIHPPAHLISGRPDWLYAMGRAAVPIPFALLPRRGVRLIQAFAANERDDPVPLDQIIVTAGQPTAVLALPPGMAIRYTWQDEASSPATPARK